MEVGKVGQPLISRVVAEGHVVGYGEIATPKTWGVDERQRQGGDNAPTLVGAIPTSTVPMSWGV